MTSLLLLARAQAQKFSAARRQPPCHLLSHYSFSLSTWQARRAESLQQLVHIEAEKGNTWPTAVHLSRQKENFPAARVAVSLSLRCEQRGEQHSEQRKRYTGGVTDSRALKHQC